MAVDTAAKRLGALKFWQVWQFGTVPSGTVNRYSALWAYPGITASTPYDPDTPTTPGGELDLNTDILSSTWNKVHIPKVEPELRRALASLALNDKLIVTNINGDVTNILDGTTPVPFTWQAYSGE